MKIKKYGKKLSLTRQTIANLNIDEMRLAKGGALGGWTSPYLCGSDTLCTVESCNTEEYWMCTWDSACAGTGVATSCC